jgi:hypothetical protein
MEEHSHEVNNAIILCNIIKIILFALAIAQGEGQTVTVHHHEDTGKEVVFEVLFYLLPCITYTSISLRLSNIYEKILLLSGVHAN